MLSVLLLAAAFAVPAPVASTATVIPTDVTSAPLVQQDLALAAVYWRAAPACGAITVEVGTMTVALGQIGTVPASEVGAETVPLSCTILVSQGSWSSRHALPVWFCKELTHEYGHSLGNYDSTTVPMMNMNLGDDPTSECVNAGD